MMRPKFTNAGRALHLRALSGVPLIFTKMQIGDGDLGEADYRTFTELIDAKATLPLTQIKVEDGAATVKGYFNNTGMTAGFYYRELGLFAKDPDDPTREILYCYANFGEEAQYIAQPSSQLIERSIRIIAVVDDAENVSAVIDGSLHFVDEQELAAAIAQHNADMHAHPNLAGFDVTFYIDAATEEAEESRDGTQEHPFISIQEAVDSLPLSALRVHFILVSGQISYSGLDSGEWIRNYDLFDIHYTGTATTRPHIDGYLRFENCQNVLLDKLRFQAGNAPQGSVQGSVELRNVCSANITRVSGALLDDSVTFLYADHSTAWISDCTTEDADTSFHSSSGSVLYLSSVTISGGNLGLYATDAQIHKLYGITNTATNPQAIYGYGIIYGAEIASDITSGAIHTHITNTAGNPHHVSLTDAQTQGGTVTVEHGGTGNTTLDEGAILLGDGIGAIDQLLGTGALYSTQSGAPQFGTLPVSAGGTGQISIPHLIRNSSSFADLYGAYPGSYALPGTLTQISGTDYWFVLMFGRVRSEAGDSISWDFETNGNWSFLDENYVLVFTNDDIETSKVHKTETGFTVDSSVAARAADFIAIGLAKYRITA